MNTVEKYDAIIIGSGAGGLSAALCLARAGKKIVVLEQHYVPGGWCHSFYRKGQRFSPGVHYIGGLDEGESGAQLYKGLGIANDLFFFRMNPKSFEHCWIGKEKIDFPANFENLKLSLSQKFPEEKKSINKYLTLVKNVSTQIHLIGKMNGFWDNVTIAYRTRHLGKYGLFSLKRVVGWHIKNPLLRMVLNIQCGDHGLPSSKASFPYHCALMDHYSNGGFYPMGGGAAIVKAMTNSIKKNGGKVQTKASVSNILLNENKIAIGVKLSDGATLYADNIISNTDPAKTFEMVGHNYLSEKLIKKLNKTNYSVSSLMFFLTVKMDVKKHGIDSGNIWYTPSTDENDAFEKMVTNGIDDVKEFEALFISCPTLKDPISFDGENYNFEVVCFIDFNCFDQFKGNENEQKYIDLKERLCKKFLTTMENVIPKLSDNIVHLEMATPFTNQHYIQGTNGNAYGTEKSFWQTGPFSFTNKTEISNLYMCGASIMSHGVVGASYSGVKAAAEILKCKEEDLVKFDESQKLQILEAEDNSNWPEWALNKQKLKTKGHSKHILI